MILTYQKELIILYSIYMNDSGEIGHCKKCRGRRRGEVPKNIALRLPRSLVKELDGICQRNMVTRPRVINMALANLLEYIEIRVTSYHDSALRALDAPPPPVLRKHHVSTTYARISLPSEIWERIDAALCPKPAAHTLKKTAAKGK